MKKKTTVFGLSISTENAAICKSLDLLLLMHYIMFSAAEPRNRQLFTGYRLVLLLYYSADSYFHGPHKYGSCTALEHLKHNN